MKTGLIGLVSKKQGFVEDAIHFFTESIWDHTFVLVGDVPDCDTVIREATKHGVVYHTLVQYFVPDTRTEIWDLGHVEDFCKALQDTRSQLGISYGVLTLVGFVWVWLCKKLGISVHNPFDQGHVCSEDTSIILRCAGFNIEPEKKCNEITPEDVARYLAKNGRLIGYSDYNSCEITWVDK